jgi:hypothetical protein
VWQAVLWQWSQRFLERRMLVRRFVPELEPMLPESSLLIAALMLVRQRVEPPLA